MCGALAAPRGRAADRLDVGRNRAARRGHAGVRGHVGQHQPHRAHVRVLVVVARGQGQRLAGHDGDPALGLQQAHVDRAGLVQHRAHVVEGVVGQAPGRVRDVDAPVVARRLGQGEALGAPVDVAEAGDDPARDRARVGGRALVDRPRSAAAGHVEHEALAPVRRVPRHRHDRVQARVVVDGHAVADEDAVGAVAVVHEHPHEAPAVAAGDRVAVALGEVHLGALLAVAVEGLRLLLCGRAQVREDDVVQHDALDRHDLAGAHVHHVGLHVGDEAVDARGADVGAGAQAHGVGPELVRPLLDRLLVGAGGGGKREHGSDHRCEDQRRPDAHHVPLPEHRGELS